MPETKPNNGNSRETLVRLVGEYLLKGMIVATACIVLMCGVGFYLAYAYSEKKLTIQDIIIIAGFGYTAARETYFRQISKRGSKQSER